MTMVNFDLQLFASRGLITQKDAANLDVGAGEFSICNLNTELNPNQTYITLGNCSAAGINWEVNSIAKRDATRGTREKIAEVETQRDATLSITMDECDPLKYALAMYGQTAIKHIAEREVIEQEFTVSPGDEIFLLADDNSDTAAYNYTDLKIRRKNNTAPQINQPVLDAQGGMVLSSGSVSSGGTYTGTTTEDYYVRITVSNSSPGTITDAEFEWRKGTAGTWASTTTMTGTAQVLSDGVAVTFAPGPAGSAASSADFQVGDMWRIRAIPGGGILILGTDYSADKVDVINGKVRISPDAGINLNEDILVSYKVPEQYVPRVYAGVQRQIECRIRFECDPTHGRQRAYTFYKVIIKPSGEDNLISEEWGSRQISGAILADSKYADPDNPESKYYRIDYPQGTNNIMVTRN